MSTQDSAPVLLEGADYDVVSLLAAHPPEFMHRNKSAVFEIASSAPPAADAVISFRRWSSDDWSDVASLTSCAEIVQRDGPFEYDGTDATWYVNFADPKLFGFYETSLFAQDEIQVAEHPSLGALRERLDGDGLRPLTVADGRPTPCTVVGAPRQCRVDLGPGADLPGGMYGNRFRTADESVVRSRTVALVDPRASNIVAISAPRCGGGLYKRAEIEMILATLVTGFSGARKHGACHEVVTGFWGCGAFGGNRVLTPALQMLAAHWSGLGRLVFHTFDSGCREFDEARLVAGALAEAASRGGSVGGAIDAALSLEFRWGESDGN